MALRRAFGALAPQLSQHLQPTSSLLAHNWNSATQQDSSSSPCIDPVQALRKFATDAVTAPAPESKLTPIQKLTVTPTQYIKYDDSVYSRYPPNSDGRQFAYFVLTGGRFLYASAIRLAVLKFVLSMTAAADVLALSSLEVDLGNIQEGQTVVVKWRGKPVFVRYRTPEEIAAANEVDLKELRDAQPDAKRVLDPKYLIVVGICTHLGCVPISGAGDYAGWFCPCHGSHYDISGRIRKGPAPYNLEVPEYRFLDDEHKKVVIG